MSYKIDPLGFFVVARMAEKMPLNSSRTSKHRFPWVNMDPLPRHSKPCEFSSELTYKRKDLKAKVRSNRAALKSQFLVEFKLTPRQDKDPNRFFHPVYNLKQNGRNIVAYAEEAEKLYKACSVKLEPFLPNQFIAGLDDESKIDMVQLYLNDKSPIIFSDAKDAIIKFHKRIGRASSFDTFEDDKQPSLRCHRLKVMPVC